MTWEVWGWVGRRSGPWYRGSPLDICSACVACAPGVDGTDILPVLECLHVYTCMTVICRGNTAYKKWILIGRVAA